jgi:acetoin utilization protein AcuC
LLVWSEALREYDFGPGHPLTPLRFGPGIDLVRAVGATRTLAPSGAQDTALARLHAPRYIEQVRSFSDHPWQPAAMGIGTPDVPAFHGMHEASSRVAGGSIGAVEAILSGQAEHAFSPAGGLHHAMRTRAAGFCVYNDVALGVAAARDAGHRVLYLDLDVHHGDGTQALFWDDPEVLTYSIHESGHYLFPGTGAADEIGGEQAPGTAVNSPLEPGSGDGSWWPVVELMLPALAAAFRPTFIVSQHGCDSHALDPLAHLRVTTDSYARACALIDRLAHEHCGGRWLATGGGGYDAYRVVPRSWALIWLAQAHVEVPTETPPDWRERWAEPARSFGQAPLPETFLDPPGTVSADPESIVDAAHRQAEATLAAALRLLGAR